jgi:hypothetical protein
MNTIKKSSFPCLDQKNKKEIAFSWCIKNKIYIYGIPLSNSKLKIGIKFKHKPEIVGDIIYNSKPSAKDLKWWDKIYELHNYYYCLDETP